MLQLDMAMATPHFSAPTTTRDQIIATAHHLFAERGFYGVSLANIGDAMGLTKQALIHHFGTKEKLYGAVLEQISDRCSAAVATETLTDPETVLDELFERFCAYSLAHPADMSLISRELLDNRERSAQAGTWYLAPFLRQLVRTVQATRKWHDAPEPQALAVAYQLLGAISFFVISEPTLSRLYGDAQFAEAADIFPGEIRRSAHRLFRE